MELKIDTSAHPPVLYTEPLPAALQVLWTPELLAMILKGLNKSTLAVMARTASMFHYFSVHRLWAEVDAGCLLRLLPPAFSCTSRPCSNLAHTSPPEEPDWSRFQLYSFHVTSLEIRLDELPKFFKFFTSRNYEFFPLLRKVSTKYTLFNAVDFRPTAWLTVVGPALRTAKISPIPHFTPAAIMRMLQELLIRCPHLEKLSLPRCMWRVEDDCVRRTSIDSIHSTLSSLSHLVSLSWKTGTIPPEVLQAIATHPGLEQVKLQCPPAGLSAGSKTWFPTLRRLRLYRCPSWAVYYWLAGLASTELLEDARLTFDETTFAGDEVGLIDGATLDPLPFIRPLAQCTNLALIRIDFHLYDDWTRVFSWKSFEPLLSCRRVSTFSLTLPKITWTDFDDDAIEKLAKSWRELEFLHVVQTWSDNASHHLVTLYGLGPLASYCPKLREVTLTVSILYNELTAEGAAAGAENNIRPTSGALERLDLHYTKFPEPTRDTSDGAYHIPRLVAKVLRGYWPTLTYERFWRYWGVGELVGAVDPQGKVQHQREWVECIRECMRGLDNWDKKEGTELIIMESGQTAPSASVEPMVTSDG